MNITITGANGYIGKNLINKLQSLGHKVKKIQRQTLYGSIPELIKELSGSDVVINLAGAPILQRWTKRGKVLIYNSRVLTTKKLVEAINDLPEKKQPKTFISASAVGIYQPDIPHDEDSNNLAADFIGKVVMDWEDASLSLKENIRRVIFRIGVVLGRDSKIIKKMLPVFKAGLGGKISNGNQAFPFIHLDDVLTAFSSAVENKFYQGVFNLTAPSMATNADFTKEMAKALNRPALFNIPSPVIKLLFGEASSVVLSSPFVFPKRLKQLEFPYKYPSLKSVIGQIMA